MTPTDAILVRAKRHANELELGVDLERVEWDVSRRARRRAGACRWDPQTETATIVLAARAYEAYEPATFDAVIRHELIHAWEFQHHGRSGHGPRFKRKADELDAPRHCPAFTEPRYDIRCAECDWTADRHRASAPIRAPERYGCGECSASLVVEHIDSGETWTDERGYQQTKAALGDAW